ncbi:MAG: hypothetical protein ACD_23C01118G0001 [uncultured bacterium]|nr:MAG: hypothetical protein ACD_23C01118G0001 [uncultured bacterium]
MVPGSTRCSPSTRMSCTLKGSRAHAALATKTMAATADAVRTPRRLMCFFMSEAGAAGRREMQQKV